jgi:hypothetical protein
VYGRNETRYRCTKQETRNEILVPEIPDRTSVLNFFCSELVRRIVGQAFLPVYLLVEYGGS